MTDRYTERIRRALVEGRDLNDGEAAHVATCVVCRDVADEASVFSAQLDAALVRRRPGPLPADPLTASKASTRRPWTAAAIAGTLLLATITVGALGSRFTATPGSSVSPASSISPNPAESHPAAWTDSPPATPGSTVCLPVVPRLLPSGSPNDGAGQRPHGDEREGLTFWTWGAGADEVIEAAGTDAFPVLDPRSLPPAAPNRMMIRGSDGAVLTIGDEGVGEVAIVWTERGCGYTIWLSPGTTTAAARSFAASLADAAPAVPLPSPRPSAADNPVVENPWSKAAVELPSENTSRMRAVASGVDGFVGVGGGGSTEGLGGMLAWYSRDGDQWTLVVDRHADRNGGSFSDVVTADGGYVAVGNNPDGSAVWLSADGQSWRPASGPSPGGHDDAILAAGSSGEAIVAVGFTSENDEQVAAVWRSVDGDSWTRLEAPDSFARAWPTDVAVGPDGSAIVVGMSEPGSGAPLSWRVDDTSVGDAIALPTSAGDVLAASVVVMPREIAAVGYAWGDDVQAYRLVLWTSTDGRSWLEHHSTTVGLPGDAFYVEGRGLVVSGATYHLDWSEVAVWELDGADRWRETLIEDSAGIGDGVVEDRAGRLIVVGASDPDGAATVWLEPRNQEP